MRWAHWISKRATPVVVCGLGVLFGASVGGCDGADEVVSFCIEPETPGGTDCAPRDEIEDRYLEERGDPSCKQFVDAESGPELRRDGQCCYRIAVESDCEFKNG